MQQKPAFGLGIEGSNCQRRHIQRGPLETEVQQTDDLVKCKKEYRIHFSITEDNCHDRFAGSTLAVRMYTHMLREATRYAQPDSERHRRVL